MGRTKYRLINTLKFVIVIKIHIKLRTLLLRKKYETIIDDVQLKRRNPEPKKWSLFDIVGTYSCGVNLTLKVGLVPMETTGGGVKYL